MEMVPLLLEVDLAPDLGILGLPLLGVFDLGRANALSGGLGTSRSPSPHSSWLISSVCEAGCPTISSSSTTAGLEGCQSPEATAGR
eukprot:9169415-Pyramimonas_sp.AAC.1